MCNFNDFTVIFPEIKKNRKSLIYCFIFNYSKHPYSIALFSLTIPLPTSLSQFLIFPPAAQCYILR